METTERQADREPVDVWHAWYSELPDEGSILVFLGTGSSERDAVAAATERLCPKETGEEPDEVAATRAWSFDGEHIVEFAPDGSQGPARKLRRVEADLLEELTAVRALVPEED